MLLVNEPIEYEGIASLRGYRSARQNGFQGLDTWLAQYAVARLQAGDAKSHYALTRKRLRIRSVLNHLADAVDIAQVLLHHTEASSPGCLEAAKLLHMHALWPEGVDSFISYGRELACASLQSPAEDWMIAVAYRDILKFVRLELRVKSDRKVRRKELSEVAARLGKLVSYANVSGQSIADILVGLAKTKYEYRHLVLLQEYGRLSAEFADGNEGVEGEISHLLDMINDDSR